jgi:hypothetical protein
MKKMYYIILFFFILIFTGHDMRSQVQNLNIIGQTPGGAGYHVNWDEANQKLIAGAGCNIYVYDMQNPASPQLIARRPLLGAIVETNLLGNVLFVAATRDGVYALDYTSPNLDILDHYYMKEMGDSGAYGMCRSNDTLYIADFYKVRMLKFNSTTNEMSLISSFGGPRAFGVDRRGNHIAVVGQSVPLVSTGFAEIYNINNLNTPVSRWSSNLVDVVMAVQFADNRDDVIYVCGGPGDILFHTSNFFAFQFDGTELSVLDTFKITGGIPGIAQFNIINMDSRNDTLFIATTASYDPQNLPWCRLFVLDATNLPGDTMEEIGTIGAGLWHFDVALMNGTPFAAIASEWGGVLITDVSQLNFLDTLLLIPTGGWNNNNRVWGNQLWACMEGYGLVVYDIDSLLFENGFWCQSELLHMQTFSFPGHFFSSDVDFINDTLIILNTSKVYNIKPWLQGGEPILQFDMNRDGMVKVMKIHTNTGVRIVTSGGGFDMASLSNKYWLQIYNPFDATNNYAPLFSDTTNNSHTGFTVSNDTVYYGKKHGNTWFLMAAKVENDQVTLLDSILLSVQIPIIGWHDLAGISVEDGIIAAAYGKNLALFKWENDSLKEVSYAYLHQRTAVGIQLRNQYMYVVDKFFGVRIYDVSNNIINNNNPVAQSRGSGGWMKPFGSNSITVAADGRIYLSDFLAGVIIIEAWDTTYIANVTENTLPQINEIHIYPNPTTGSITIEIHETASIIIVDMNGKTVWSTYADQLHTTHDLSMLASGLYSVIALNANGITAKKLLIAK